MEKDGREKVRATKEVVKRNSVGNDDSETHHANRSSLVLISGIRASVKMRPSKYSIM